MSTELAVRSLRPVERREPPNVGGWVRETREEQAMSVRALAAGTGLSPSFISQVEHGVTSPSIASLARICGALGATLADCLTASGEIEDRIVRSGDRQRVSEAWPDARVEALGPRSGSRLQPVLVTLAPGEGRAGFPGARSTEEFTFVLVGQPVLILGGREHALQAGDAVTIPAREARGWENRTPAVVKMLSVSLR